MATPRSWQSGGIGSVAHASGPSPRAVTYLSWYACARSTQVFMARSGVGDVACRPVEHRVTRPEASLDSAGLAFIIAILVPPIRIPGLGAGILGQVKRTARTLQDIVVLGAVVSLTSALGWACGEGPIAGAPSPRAAPVFCN